jgi:Xaa-Pro aminopeptidase
MDKNFYIKSRERVASLLPDNSMMILFAGRDVRESEDQSYEFCINRNFYYLTGVNEQNDILVMIKENNKLHSMMFINEYDELFAKWNGRKLFAEEVSELSGISDVRYLKDFDEFLNVNKNKYALYMDISKNLFTEPMGEEQKLLAKLDVEVNNCYDFIAKCRMEKQPEEIEVMKKAISVTNKGIQALMQNIKPGLYEYQVESYFDQQIKFNGASGIAFKTIAASGENGCVLHYHTNNTMIKDNDLVLFDLGAEYDLYKSDITRTIPANGKFTERQKLIYNIVLNGQKLVFENIKPGISPMELNNILIKYYQVELKKIGLIEKDEDVKKYYFHGVSHHLGLDTHDVGGRGAKLTPGCVITVEPGLYIAEEGIGIRIEDDALVTEDGCINLSSEIIKTVEDIEEYMLKYRR